MPLWVTAGNPKVAFLCITPVRLVYEANCCLYVIEVSSLNRVSVDRFASVHNAGSICCSERNYSDFEFNCLLKSLFVWPYSIITAT
jgi:hypothetical protein